MNNSHHEALYEAFFDTTPGGIIIVSEDGRTIELNASMCRFLRAPREQLIGRHFRDFIPPERVDEAFAAFAKLKSEGTLAVEFPMRAIDGTIINLEWRSRANFVSGLHLCIARDLTTRDESEERHRAFIAHSSEAIWRFELDEPVPVTLDPDEQIDRYYRFGYLAECNDVMAQQYGFEKASDIVGARLGDMLLRDDPNNIAFLRAFIESGYRLTDAESVETDRDGNTKYFLNNFTGIIENGLVLRGWGMQRDITERKKIELTLRDREQHLEAIVRNASLGIAQVDANGRFIFGNEPYCRLVGRSLDELRQLRIADITHPEDVDRNVAMLDGIVANGEDFIIEKRYVRPDNSVVWARIATSALRDPDGHVAAMIGIAEDVTARRAADARAQDARAEAEAAEQRATFVAEASAILVSSLDYEHTLAAFADFAIRFADQCVIDLIDEFARQRRIVGYTTVHLQPKLDRTIAGGEAQLLEIENANAIVVPLVARGRILGAMAFVRMHSDRRFNDAEVVVAKDLGRRAGLAVDNARLYRELERANRAKDDFLAILSHELRTPMTAILGWASMLQLGGLGEGTMESALDTIVQSTRAQAKLIDDLLDVSRIVAGKMQLALQPGMLCAAREPGNRSARTKAGAF